jgi:hypothetical protein
MRVGGVSSRKLAVMRFGKFLLLVKVAGSQGYKEGTPTVVITRDVVFCQKAGTMLSMWGQQHAIETHRPNGRL